MSSDGADRKVVQNIIVVKQDWKPERPRRLDYWKRDFTFSTTSVGWPDSKLCCHQRTSQKFDKKIGLHHLRTSSQVDPYDNRAAKVRSLKKCDFFIEILFLWRPCCVVLPVLASSSAAMPLIWVHCWITVSCDYFYYDHCNSPLLPFPVANGSNPGKWFRI